MTENQIKKVFVFLMEVFLRYKNYKSERFTAANA